MKIRKIKIENYRLLKDFEIDLEDELSLVIGKNNTGKTSLLSVLDKFLNPTEKNKFYFEDFNLDFKAELESLILDSPDLSENNFQPIGIKLKLIIEYYDGDNLSNINRLMMDLDPNNNVIVLGFEYVLTYDHFQRLINDLQEYLKKEKKKVEDKKPEIYAPKNISQFLKEKYSSYFNLFKKSIEYNIDNEQINENIFIDLEQEKIPTKDVINFKYISAKRDVSNREVDKSLSMQTSKIYRKTETNDLQKEAIEEFQDRLTETDTALSDIYSELFKDIIKKVSTFGGIRENESLIEILSTLQHRELLEGNTTVMYNHEGNILPEHYNGLGYMNLISMLFEIEILLLDFKRKRDELPADINFLFIEEPEAHTHPQMQYIFIKNIKSLLDEGVNQDDGEYRDLQYIISTHSSHIVAESNFDDIRYLHSVGKNEVVAKSLKALELEYKTDGEEQNYRFLKQYLTLNRAELFFADKAIFIEGDTERILLPAMMKKVDQEAPHNPLLSQNISIVEVGAYSQIFEKFIDFIGVKSLIITDIDSYYEKTIYEDDGTTPKKYGNGEIKKETIKCPANDPNATKTSNNSLKFFHKKNDDLKYYKELPLEWKILRKNKHKKWVSNRKGYLLTVYQIEHGGYHARSFEDAFSHLNKDFIIDTDNIFDSMIEKWLKKYKGNNCDVYEFSDKAIASKPSFAIEILLNSRANGDGFEFSNWEIPIYIKEGLLWLKQE